VQIWFASAFVNPIATASQALKSEMEKVVGKEVVIMPGKLVVDGNFQLRLKKWLIGMGF
jgi:hypothetical protein